MPPRTKRAKNITAGTSARAEKKKISGWERSKISSQDHRMLKKMGLLKDEAIQMPGDEIHEFLCGLLFIYGIQLDQLTPNSILQISIFITLCECFLGIQPHWGLWKRIFYLRRNNSKNAIYNVVKRVKFLHPAAWNHSVVPTPFQLIIEYFLRFFLPPKVEMYLSEPSSPMTRKKLMFVTVNPQNLKRVRVPLFSAEKIGEMYTRNQDTEEDALLDTLSVLEMNCTLARDCLTAARISFERMFPHFFPKAELPDRFELLAKSFTDKGDPVLAHRQSSLKIGVEGTIALVMASDEKVNWAKVAAVRGLNSDKWTALIKGAKAFSKKIIAIIDPKSSASASTAQTEVK
ncbi:hypothetical protein ACQ4PT_000917 [Festuca glaucescens]